MRIIVAPRATYTRAKLKSVARRIVNSPQAREIGLTEVSVNSDASGLRVGVTADVPSAVQQAEFGRFAGLPASVITYAPNVNIVPLPAKIVDRD